MRIIYADRYQPERMVIGIRGESDTTRVYFDSPERETAAALLVKRRTDAESYGVELKRENGWLIWDVSLMDTSVDGLVKAELTWVKDTEVRKKEYVFHVERSQEKPIIDKRDPKVEYLSKVMGAAQEALERKAEIKEAAEEAKQAAADAEEILIVTDQYRRIAQHNANASGEYAQEARLAKDEAVNAQAAAELSKQGAEAARTGIEEKLTQAAGYAQTAGEKAAEAGRMLDQVMYTRDQVGRFQDGAQYFYEETKKLHDQDDDEYAELKEDVRNLIGAVEKHDGDIEDLKEKEADNEAAIEAQKQLVLRQEQRVAEAEVRVSNVARTVDVNQGRINALENDLVNHKSTFDSFKAETAGKFTTTDKKIDDTSAELSRDLASFEKETDDNINLIQEKYKELNLNTLHIDENGYFYMEGDD